MINGIPWNEIRGVQNVELKFINQLKDVVESGLIKKYLNLMDGVTNSLSIVSKNFNSLASNAASSLDASIFVKELDENIGLFGNTLKLLPPNIKENIGKSINELEKLNPVTRSVFALGRETRSYSKFFIATAKEIKEGVKKVFSKPLSIGKSLFTGIEGAYKTLSSVVGAIGKAFKFVDGIAQNFNGAKKLAGDIGSSMENVMRLQHIAKATGVSTETLNNTLTRLASTAKSALTNPTSQASKAFRLLGIDVANCDGTLKDTSVLFEEVAGKLHGLSEQDQLEMMDKLGIDRSMLRMITADVGGLSDEFRQMSEAAGINFDEAAQKSEQFSAGLHKFQVLFSFLGNVFGAELMGPLQEGLTIFTQLVIENMPTISKAFGIVGKAIGGVIKILAVLGKIVFTVFEWVSPILEWIIDTVGSVVGWVASLFGVSSNKNEEAAKPATRSAPQVGAIDGDLVQTAYSNIGQTQSRRLTPSQANVTNNQSRTFTQNNNNTVVVNDKNHVSNALHDLNSNNLQLGRNSQYAMG